MRYIVVPIHALSARPGAGAPGNGARPDAGSSAPDAGSYAVADAPPDAASYAPYADVSEQDTLAHWVSAAKTSLDACLVVDAGGTVAGLSPTAADLLGTDGSVVGRSLDEVLCLVDFTDMALEARGAERRIPPLIAVRENSLSRGMMRVRRPDGHRLMLDAVAAPIHDEERKPIGAVSFIASV